MDRLHVLRRAGGVLFVLISARIPLVACVCSLTHAVLLLWFVTSFQGSAYEVSLSERRRKGLMHHMGTPSKEMYDKVLEQQVMTIAPLQERFYGSKYFTGLPDEIKIMQRLPQYKDVAPPGKDGCMGNKGRWDHTPYTFSPCFTPPPAQAGASPFCEKKGRTAPLPSPLSPHVRPREDNFIFLSFDFFTR